MLEIVPEDSTSSIIYTEILEDIIHHIIQGSDSTTPKIHHQDLEGDLEEVSEEETREEIQEGHQEVREDQQEEAVIQED